MSTTTPLPDPPPDPPTVEAPGLSQKTVEILESLDHWKWLLGAIGVLLVGLASWALLEIISLKMQTAKLESVPASVDEIEKKVDANGEQLIRQEKLPAEFAELKSEVKKATGELQALAGLTDRLKELKATSDKTSSSVELLTKKMESHDMRFQSVDEGIEKLRSLIPVSQLISRRSASLRLPLAKLGVSEKKANGTLIRFEFLAPEHLRATLTDHVSVERVELVATGDDVVAELANINLVVDASGLGEKYELVVRIWIPGDPSRFYKIQDSLTAVVFLTSRSPLSKSP